jgi:hypothetical protein
VRFNSWKWQYLGSKSILCNIISDVTSIETNVLAPGPFSLCDIIIEKLLSDEGRQLREPVMGVLTTFTMMLFVCFDVRCDSVTALELWKHVDDSAADYTADGLQCI